MTKYKTKNENEIEQIHQRVDGCAREFVTQLTTLCATVCCIDFKLIKNDCVGRSRYICVYWYGLITHSLFDVCFFLLYLWLIFTF